MLFISDQHGPIGPVGERSAPAPGSYRAGRRRGPARRGLMLGCSLFALMAALGPATAQNLARRPPSDLGLTASDFDTPEYRADWGLAQINAATAYARGFTGLGVLVAVYDTGIDRTHPEFTGRISSASENVFSAPRRSVRPDLRPGCAGPRHACVRHDRGGPRRRRVHGRRLRQHDPDPLHSAAGQRVEDHTGSPVDGPAAMTMRPSRARGS